VRSSLAAGVVLAWARAVGEFGATILFAGSLMGRSQTMSLAIYSALEIDLDLAVALAVILLGVSGAILALMRLLRVDV
jgi:molybdate transport system permease protein